VVLKLRDSEPFQVQAHSQLYFGVCIQISAPVYVIPKGTHPDRVCVKYIVLGGVVSQYNARHNIPKYFWHQIVFIIVTE